MRRIRFAVIAFLLGLGAAAESDGAGAGEAEAWAALRAGRHVALMRHADAPGGFGDPPGFRLDDCAPSAISVPRDAMTRCGSARG